MDMITLSDVYCKDYMEIFKPERGEEEKEEIRRWLSSAQCPNKSCHAIGQFNNHGYYTRNIENLTEVEEHGIILTVLRGKCKSCETTHAFLPADIIPYKWPLIVCFLTTMMEQFNPTKERIPDGRDRENQCNSGEQPKSDQDKDGYSYKGPFTLRMAYRNLELLIYYLKYLQHTIRDLQLWEKARQPELWEAVEILLSTDLRLFQRRTGELHHEPLFFRRKRTANGIPHTGMLKTG